MRCLLIQARLIFAVAFTPAVTLHADQPDSLSPTRKEFVPGLRALQAPKFAMRSVPRQLLESDLSSGVRDARRIPSMITVHLRRMREIFPLPDSAWRAIVAIYPRA